MSDEFSAVPLFTFKTLKNTELGAQAIERNADGEIVVSGVLGCLGRAAAVAGRWLERVGPRCVGVTAAILWGGGFLIGSAGEAVDQLWLQL